MIDKILLFANASLILLFGVYLSAAFAGIRFTRKNILICFILCLFSGALQIGTYVMFSEAVVWKIYPLISHLPLFLLLYVVYRQRAVTAIASICTAYLCCQPSKWFGILAFHLTQSTYIDRLVRICVLILVFIIVFSLFADSIFKIFSKDTRSVCIFGITPVVYYIFDYASEIYTNLWASHIQVAAEFLSFFLSITFLIFCLVYYREYEQKTDSERKEKMIQLIVEEQKKELEAVKRSEHEIRLLRHDLRFFLLNLSMCIENEDKATAKKMISSFIDSIETTTLNTYCQNPTLNYIISAFAERCRKLQFELVCQIDVADVACDEIMLSTIISNGLDNAINAQELIPVQERKIYLMLKNANGKLLLSIKNTMKEKPVFVNDMPISTKNGHGYGTQSITYLTERLGGCCQFTTEGNYFILRVII